MKNLLIKAFFLTFLSIIIIGTNATSANETHDRLSKLSTKDRNDFFTIFMRKSNEDCGIVIKSFFQGFSKTSGSAFWNVACTNKKTFVIMINNDATGSTKILECSVVKLLTKVDCFKKFSDQ